MRHFTMRCLAVAVTCVAGGCNQPAVTPKVPAFQSSENTVRDWNDVAHKISAEMASLGLVPAYTFRTAAVRECCRRRSLYLLGYRR